MDRNSMRSAKLSGLGLALMMGATMMLPLPALSLTTQEILNYRGPDREQILLEGAKKEGQVTLYCALIVNQALKSKPIICRLILWKEQALAKWSFRPVLFNLIIRP